MSVEDNLEVMRRMEIEMVTVAKVQNGQLVEVKRFFDNLSVMKQLGLV